MGEACLGGLVPQIVPDHKADVWGLPYLDGVVSKPAFVNKAKAACAVQPQEYSRYFEDWAP
jgi:hypothetical protein